VALYKGVRLSCFNKGNLLTYFTYLRELFKILKRLSRVGVDELFMLDENMKGTRDHCLKLRKPRCTADITRHFF